MKRILEGLILFILSVAFLKNAFAETYLVEFSAQLREQDRAILLNMNDIKKVEQFDSIEDEYFKRLYEIEGAAGLTYEKLNSSKELEVKVVKLEKSYKVEGQSLRPTSHLDYNFGDTLLSYQWYLANQGQVVFQDIDDIRSRAISGKPGADIGIKNIWNELATLQKEDVIVAVVDSGLDLRHPDIKNNIYKNTKECDSEGEIITQGGEDTVLDNDQNDLHGDCMGWDFTRAKNDPAARFPYDDVGHGTHVAGLIAAESNDFGISGQGGKIKILPIKVLSGGDSSGNSPIGMTDRLARGILYAVKMGAKVINLSLGWPKSIDTEYLRRAVGLALSRGITIVAASGNNNTFSPIFPCAYHHVICVGATQIDGDYAVFSNFGGQVDLLAPGDHILSLYPLHFSPLQFSLMGYEIKNGTSQAAPLVSLTVALLKSSFPGIVEDEIKSRLFLTATPVKSDDKFSLAGLINIEKALKIEKRSAVFPILKELDQIPYMEKTGDFMFDLRIKNFWGEGHNIKVSLDAQGALLFTQNQFTWEVAKEGESALFKINGKVKSSRQDNLIKLKFSVDADGEHREYIHIIPLVRIMGGDESISHFPVELKIETHRLAEINNGLLFPNIATIDDSLRFLPSPVYFLTKTTKGTPNDGIEIFLFDWKSEKVVERSKSIFLKEAEKIISVSAGDYNYDRKVDFLVRSIHKGEEGPYIQYSFYDQDFNPLYDKDSFWKFTPEVVVENQANLAFIPYNFKNHGKVAIPLFAEIGRLPKLDNATSVWEDADNSIQNRIYYLEPQGNDGAISLQTRALSKKSFIQAVKKQLFLTWNDTVAVIGAFSQGRAKFNQGVGEFNLSIGKGFLRKEYLLKVKSVDDYSISELPFSRMRVESDLRYPLAFLNDEQFIPYFGDSYIGFRDNSTAKISHYYSGQTSQSLKATYFQRSSFTDHVLGHIASYADASGTTSIFQTKGNLLFVRSENGKDYEGLYPIARFSFLPGKVLNDLFFPVVTLDQEGKPTPAIFVDNTQINSNRLHIIQASAQKIKASGEGTAPAQFSFLVPNNCKAMNPVLFGENAFHSLIFLCKYNGNSWAFKKFDLK